MAKRTIPCGGFSYDDTQIKFENGEMKVIGGGGSSDVLRVIFEIYEDYIVSSHTPEEIKTAQDEGKYIYASAVSGGEVIDLVSLIDRNDHRLKFGYPDLELFYLGYYTIGYVEQESAWEKHYYTICDNRE